MPVRVPIGLRVFITLVILFAVLAAGIGVLISATVAGTVERAVIGNIGRDTSLLAKNFETWIAQKIQVLETLKAPVLLDRDNPEYILDLLTRETRGDTDFISVFYGTAEYDGAAVPVGDGLVRSGDSFLALGSGFTVPRGFDWTHRPWFVRARDVDESVLCDPYVDVQTGEVVVSISRAVRDDDGKLVGVLGLDLYIAHLTNVISAQKFTPTSKTYLIDATGSYITNEDKSRVLMGEEPAGNIFAPGSPLAAMNAAILDNSGTWDRDLKKNLFWASRRIPHTGWTVVTYGAFSDIARPIQEFYATLSWIMCAAMIAAVVFALVEARAISTPIAQLKRGAIEMAKGNYDWTVSIRRKDEFGDLGEFFNKVSASLKENIRRIEGQRTEIEDYSRNLEGMVAERTRQLDRANKELLAHNRQMEKELQMAEVVQRKIIPQAHDLPSVPELSFGARYMAMQAVGGDLYDILPLDERRYGILIADVSGHGMAAALVAAMAKVAFRSYAAGSPAEVCRAANREIYELIGGETYYLSAFYLILDTETGRIVFSNAGHPPILLIRKDGSVERLDTAGGQLLGISDDFAFEEGEARLFPGDSLLLFTDGILEARGPSGKFYEYRRLMEYARNNQDSDADDFIQGLMDDVDNFSKGTPRTDDRAALWVRLTAYRPADRTETDWKTRLDQADGLLKAGDARSAALLLEDIRVRRPDDPKVLNLLGMACLRLGNRERAVRLLETAVVLAPNSRSYRKDLEDARTGS